MLNTQAVLEHVIHSLWYVTNALLVIIIYMSRTQGSCHHNFRHKISVYAGLVKYKKLVSTGDVRLANITGLQNTDPDKYISVILRLFC